MLTRGDDGPFQMAQRVAQERQPAPLAAVKKEPVRVPQYGTQQSWQKMAVVHEQTHEDFQMQVPQPSSSAGGGDPRAVVTGVGGTTLRTAWSEAEERTLMSSQARLGNKWGEIAQGLPDRNANMCKKRFKRLQAKNDGAVKQEPDEEFLDISTEVSEASEWQFDGTAGRWHAHQDGRAATTTTSSAPASGGFNRNSQCEQNCFRDTDRADPNMLDLDVLMNPVGGLGTEAVSTRLYGMPLSGTDSDTDSFDEGTDWSSCQVSDESFLDTDSFDEESDVWSSSAESVTTGSSDEYIAETDAYDKRDTSNQSSLGAATDPFFSVDWWAGGTGGQDYGQGYTQGYTFSDDLSSAFATERYANPATTDSQVSSLGRQPRVANQPPPTNPTDGQKLHRNPQLAKKRKPHPSSADAPREQVENKAYSFASWSDNQGAKRVRHRPEAAGAVFLAGMSLVGIVLLYRGSADSGQAAAQLPEAWSAEPGWASCLPGPHRDEVVAVSTSVGGRWLGAGPSQQICRDYPEAVYLCNDLKCELNIKPLPASFRTLHDMDLGLASVVGKYCRCDGCTQVSLPPIGWPGSQAQFTCKQWAHKGEVPDLRTLGFGLSPEAWLDEIGLSQPGQAIGDYPVISSDTAVLYHDEHEQTLSVWKTDSVVAEHSPENALDYPFPLDAWTAHTHDGKEMPAIHVYDIRADTWTSRLIMKNQNCDDQPGSFAAGGGGCTPGQVVELGNRFLPIAWVDPSGTPMLFGGRVCTKTTGPHPCSVGDRASAYNGAGTNKSKCTIAAMSEDTVTVTWDDAHFLENSVMPLSDVDCLHPESRTRDSVGAGLRGAAWSDARRGNTGQEEPHGEASCARFGQMDDIWALVTLSAGTASWTRLAEGWADPARWVGHAERSDSSWPHGRAGAATWTRSQDAASCKVPRGGGDCEHMEAEVWMFGGAAGVFDWEQLPVSALWRFQYSTRIKSETNEGEGFLDFRSPGTGWTLVTGHAVDVVGPGELNRDSWNQWMAGEGASAVEINAGPADPENLLRYMAGHGGVAIDSCNGWRGGARSTDRMHGGGTGDSRVVVGRCPAARSGAAAWRGSTGGWIFGGTAAAAGGGWNRTAVGRELVHRAFLQTANGLVPDATVGLGGAVVLHDLWHFDGDTIDPVTSVIDPIWRRIRYPIGAGPGSPLWPPGVLTADASWLEPGTDERAGRSMALVLLIGEPKPPRKPSACDPDGCLYKAGLDTGHDCVDSWPGNRCEIGIAGGFFTCEHDFVSGGDMAGYCDMTCGICHGGCCEAADEPSSIGCRDGLQLHLPLDQQHRERDLPLQHYWAEEDQAEEQPECPTGRTLVCCVEAPKLHLWSFAQDTELWSKLDVSRQTKHLLKLRLHTHGTDCVPATRR